MNRKLAILTLCVLLFHLPFVSAASAGGLKKSRFFGGIALLSSLTAIYCDARVEENFRKYNDANDASNCTKYRNRTRNYEKARDAFIIISFSSVVTSLVFSKLEESGIDIELQGDEKELRLNIIKRF